MTVPTNLRAPNGSPLAIVRVAGDYAASPQQIVAVDTSGAAHAVTLPAPIAGRVVAVGDDTGNAVAHNVTVNVTAGGTIDGASSFAIATAGQVEGFVADGSEWKRSAIARVIIDPATGVELDVYELATLLAEAQSSGAMLFGTFASRPASATSGQAYFATDTQQIFVWNGAAWIGGTLLALNSTSGVAGIVIATVDGSAVLRVGDATNNTASVLEANGPVELYSAGTFVILSSTAFASQVPRIGYQAAYAVDGKVTSTMVDADFTVPSTEYVYGEWCTSGSALTAQRNVTFPLPGSDAASYGKWIQNGFSAGANSFGILVGNGGGASVLVAPGETAFLWFDTAGAHKRASSLASPITVGTYASRPPAAQSTLFYPTDGLVPFISNGATWAPLIGGTQGTQVPAVGTLTSILAGGRATTQSDAQGTILMAASNLAGADDFRSLVKAAPGGAYSFTVHLRPTLEALNYCGAGVLWRQSSNGNCQFFGVITDNAVSGLAVLCRNETASGTGASPTYTTGADLIALAGYYALPLGDAGIWLRLTDDGTTNRTFLISHDGINFLTLATTGRTTTITPDQIGIWVGNANSAGTTTKVTCSFDSWKAA